jgi:hypothetical protein
MTSHETPGYLRRMWTALRSALKRGVLGKSSHDYMKQFTGSDEYWDRVIAAQLGWPQEQPQQPDAKPKHAEFTTNRTTHPGTWPSNPFAFPVPSPGNGSVRQRESAKRR